MNIPLTKFERQPCALLREDGTVAAKGFLVDSKKTGYWEWYRTDGTIKQSGYYSDDDPVSIWMIHDEVGKPMRQFRGEDAGHLAGLPVT